MPWQESTVMEEFLRFVARLPAPLERLIVETKREKPHWGAQDPRTACPGLAGDVRIPARSTVHAVLDRHGLVKGARTRRSRADGTPIPAGRDPNDLWCVDFKGEVRLGNGRYCYPLTVSDHASRFILSCEALESVKEAGAVLTWFRNVQVER